MSTMRVEQRMKRKVRTLEEELTRSLRTIHSQHSKIQELEREVASAQRIIATTIQERNALQKFAFMDSQEWSFVLKLLKSPEDQLTILVFADWLEEAKRDIEANRLREVANKGAPTSNFTLRFTVRNVDIVLSCQENIFKPGEGREVHSVTGIVIEGVLPFSSGEEFDIDLPEFKGVFIVLSEGQLQSNGSYTRG